MLTEVLNQDAIDNLRCGNGGAVGGKKGSRSKGGGGGGSQEPLNSDENKRKLEELYTDSSTGELLLNSIFLDKAVKVDGGEDLLREMLNAPKMKDVGSIGGVGDRLKITTDAANGQIYGTPLAKVRAKEIRQFMEPVQGVLFRNDIPFSKFGAHTIGETYRQMSPTQRQRFAYEATRGSYPWFDRARGKLDLSILNRIPQKDVRDDLAARMTKAFNSKRTYSKG